MFLIQIVPCLLLLTDWSESKGLVSPPGGVVVAPSGGGVSKQHRQQDDYGNYNFAYEVQDPTSHQFRKETGDAYGRIVGSYGLSEIDGRQRIVDYVADEYGFRAKVRTNEPGTGAENSAAVEVLKAGHPPAPPRIPAISSAPPPPAPPPPPPPPPPVRPISAVTSSGKSISNAQVPVSGYEYPPYIQHPPPYGHPYYYTPIKSSFGNAIYPLPQTRQSLYIPQPQAQSNYDRYDDKYKPQVQSYFPVPPPIKEPSQKYVSSVYDLPVPQPPDLSLPSGTTLSKSRHSTIHSSPKFPANYRVIHIPNGIQAVPIDGPNPSPDIRDRYPYQYQPGNFPREPYSPGRNPVYLGHKSGQKTYVNSPRDYSFAGTSETKSIAEPEKEEPDES